MNVISNLFRRNNQYLIGVDIGNGFLKICEIDHSHSPPKLTAIGIAALSPGVMVDGSIDNPVLFAEQLHQLMLTAGCRSRNAVLSIGGKSAFIREYLFPIMKTAELKEAIFWDVEKYIPLVPDSYYYDYSIVDKSDTDLMMRVLIAAASKEEIDARMAIAKQADINLIAIDIDALAIGRAIKLDSGLLIDIGESITQIIIFQGGSPVAARSVMLGGRNFTLDIMQVLGLTKHEAELLKVRQTGLLRPDNADDTTDVHNKLFASVEILAKEMVKTVEIYKMQNREVILDKAILAGGGAKLDNLSKHLERLSGMAVVLIDPFSSVGSGAFDPQYVRGFAEQLAVAIGLAMRRGNR